MRAKLRMLRFNTPIEYYKEYNLYVKREDLSCKPPGPPFSKTRGVFEHVRKRPEKLIGVLDTFHSQAGHAVARACQLLGKKCINFYPKYKKDLCIREPQLASKKLGARLKPLQAGRSCILFHQAKKITEEQGGYMMPNALKLDESVEETAKEVPENHFDNIIIPASSGTIAKGVVRGVCARLDDTCRFIIHLGYSRSHDAVRSYVKDDWDIELEIVDEGYAYKDVAKKGLTPPWPCNPYYDLKAFRWWIENRSRFEGRTLFWNIG